MEKRTLGATGLEVSRLGLGLARIDRMTLSDRDAAAALLDAALDGGITFIDTAAKYGHAEELIGLTIAGRRDEYVLASKFGSPWNGTAASESIENSLRLMRTDRIDLMQVHSAGVEDLERGDIIEALDRAKQAGKVLHTGYAGDNEAARWAVESGAFETIQTSFNLADQAALNDVIPAAKSAGMGIIAKRPIANSAWGGNDAHAATTGQYSKLQERCRVLEMLGPIGGAPADRIELALQFTLAHAVVDVAIVGTTKSAHVRENIVIVDSAPPLDQATVSELHRRFNLLGAEWIQLT